MKNIPLWGKITGGCALIFVFLLIVGGCVGLVAVVTSTSDPVASPTVEEPLTTEVEPTEDPTTETEPTEEPTTEPEPTEDVVHPTNINTCVPDQDQAMAEVVASITSADVTIYTDQVFIVPADSTLDNFYVVAGSDVGTIILFNSTNINGDPMAYAANETAYTYTALVYPEELGAPPIDTESEAFKVAEGCVS